MGPLCEENVETCAFGQASKVRVTGHRGPWERLNRFLMLTNLKKAIPNEYSFTWTLSCLKCLLIIYPRVAQLVVQSGSSWVGELVALFAEVP